MDRKIRKPNLGVAKEQVTCDVDGSALFRTCYAGRQVDYAGAGLHLLTANRNAYGPLCLYHCMTGRPFQYLVTNLPDEWLNPYYSFVDGIKHALCVLELTNCSQMDVLDKSVLTNKLYSQKMNGMISQGPVLIGPFNAKHFENEFSHTYRLEPNHCLVCVASYKNEYLLLHPDGLPYIMSIEQLLDLHRVSLANAALLLSISNASQFLPIQQLMERTLIAGAKIVQRVCAEHGPAAFLKCILDIAKPSLKVKSELTIRLGLSQMSINLLMILELVRHLLKYDNLTLLDDSVVYDLRQPLFNVLRDCAATFASPIEAWFEDGECLYRLSVRWELYENALCSIISTSEKNGSV